MSYAMIPVDNTSNASLSFKLTLDSGSRNIDLTIKLRYLDLYSCWLMDITDNNTNTEVVSAMPLVCGVNILGQLGYKSIGEAYIVPTEPTTLQQPDNTTLGSTFELWWGDSSE